jgi:hypothetical protein
LKIFSSADGGSYSGIPDPKTAKKTFLIIFMPMNHSPPLDESQFAAVAAAGQLGTQAGGLILQVLPERQESSSKGDRFMLLFMLAGRRR